MNGAFCKRGFLCAVYLLAAAHSLESAAQEKKLLFLTHAGFYKHACLGTAETMVKAWGAENGFAVTTVEGYKSDRDAIDLSIVTPAYLNEFDAVMFFTNGNLPMNAEQKEALRAFVEGGKGLIGVHCASLSFYDWPEWGEMLGGYFRRACQQNRVMVLKVEDRDHPATRMLGPSWPLSDEFYLFGMEAWTSERPEANVDVLFGNKIPVGFSRDRVRVLLSIDTELSNMEGAPDMEVGGDYPQAWCRDYGKGRTFYTSLGHRAELWEHSLVFRDHIVGAIRWAIGLDEGNATPTGKRQ